VSKARKLKVSGGAAIVRDLNLFSVNNPSGAGLPDPWQHPGKNIHTIRYFVFQSADTDFACC
jgi:hypothetical protein